MNATDISHVVTYEFIVQIMEEFKEMIGQEESPEDIISNCHKWQPKVSPYAAILNKTGVKEFTI